MQLTPDVATRICDVAHKSPNSAHVRHHDGFCLACAEIYVAVNTVLTEGSKPLSVEAEFDDLILHVNETVERLRLVFSSMVPLEPMTAIERGATLEAAESLHDLVIASDALKNTGR